MCGYESSKQFNNKPVVDLSSETKKQDLSKISPMVRVDVFEEKGKQFQDYFEHFLATQDTSNLDSLVIGYWSDDYDMSDTKPMSKMIESLFTNIKKLSALKALFVGAIEQEESEVSWIELADLAPFINKDFSLEYFRARGAGNFFKSDLKSTTLKKLALETGGMSATTIQHILRSDLPNLEYLELWIGDDNYGSTTVDTLIPLLNTKQFSKLRYLGLRNCDFADELAIPLANAPILEQLEILDLSLGALGNTGAEALATSKLLGNLKKLNVDHHYIDDAALKKLKEVVSELSSADKQEVDVYDGEEYRYIFVSE
jgi:hypothetical protein